MRGMTVDDGDNIIIKNNEIIGLTVRPDGAVRTPKGGAGGNPVYAYKDIGHGFELLCCLFFYEIGNGLYCVEINGCALSKPSGIHEWEYGINFQDILDSFGVVGKAYQYGEWEFYNSSGSVLSSDYMRYGGVFSERVAGSGIKYLLFCAIIAGGNVTNHNASLIVPGNRLKARIFIM